MDKVVSFVVGCAIGVSVCLTTMVTTSAISNASLVERITRTEGEVTQVANVVQQIVNALNGVNRAASTGDAPETPAQ